MLLQYAAPIIKAGWQGAGILSSASQDAMGIQRHRKAAASSTQSGWDAKGLLFFFGSSECSESAILQAVLRI
jgi:hypothetical protein